MPVDHPRRIHPADCACPACLPPVRHGAGEALAIAALTLVLVAVTLAVVWAGARLNTLFTWS